MSNRLWRDNETAEERLTKTFFIVEATRFERLALWQARAYFLWEEVNPGWLITVGKLDHRPCCISTSWALLGGFLVMFWYNCSQVTDQVQTDAWLQAHFKGTYDNGTRRAECDAMNFGHCLNAVKDAMKEEAKK